jgi:hypothetical protein
MLDHLIGTEDIYNVPEDNNTIRVSLRKRWAALKHDQDFYIAAIFFNPWLRAYFFNPEIHSLSRLGLYNVIKHIYRRMNGLAEDAPMPEGFFQQYIDYYDGVKIYTADILGLAEFWEIHGKRVRAHALLQSTAHV